MHHHRKGIKCTNCTPYDAWNTIKENGISKNECCPFMGDSTSIPFCIHSKTCEMAGKNQSKDKIVVYKSLSTSILKQNRHEAMLEIIRGGPIQTEMNVFEDFEEYRKNTIYSYRYGNFIGRISVKVLILNY